MPLFKNRQTGEVVRFEGDAALNAARSGVYAVVGDEAIDVVTPSGRTTAYAAGDLPAVDNLELAGADQEAAMERQLAERDAAQDQVVYGHGLGQVRTFGEGVLSGATLGLYDVIAPDSSKEFARVNPKTRVAGEVVGLVGSAVVPGLGAGRLAKAASMTPAGAVTAASTKLGKQIGGLKGSVAAAAVEGAGYALGQTTSHVLITDEPLTAEAVVAEIGRNTLFGLGVGAGAGAIAHGLNAAGSKLIGKVDGMTAPVVDMSKPAGRRVAKDMAKAVTEIDELANRAMGQADNLGAGGFAARNYDEMVPAGPAGDLPELAAVTKAAPEAPVPPELQPLLEVPEGKLMNRLERKVLTSVGDQMLDDMIAKAEQARLAGKVGKEFVPEVRKLKRMRAELQKVFEEAEAGGSTRAANAAAKSYEGYLRELGKKLDFDVSSQLDRAAVKVADEATPQVAPVAQVDEVVPPPQPAPQPQVDVVPPSPVPVALENVKVAQAAVKKAMGLAPTEAITAQHIAKLLNSPTTELLPTLGLLDDYYKSLGKFAETQGDEVLMGQLDAAMKQLGESAAIASGGTKLTDGDRALIAAALGSEALEATGFEGPIDDLAQLALLAKLAKGQAPGVAQPGRRGGGVLRAMVMRAGSYGTRQAARNAGIGGTSHMGQALVTGAAAPLGYHGFGKLFDSVVGQRAIAGVGHAGVGRISAALSAAGKGIKRIARPASVTGMSLLRSSNFSYDESGPKPAPKSNLEAFKQRQQELAAVLANPDAAQEKIHESLAGMREINPMVADHVEMISIAIPTYLADKMPKDPGVIQRFGKSTWQPSDYEIRQWAEHYKGALAPMEVFEEALEGHVTPQAAEAVRTLYPKLFERMQMELWQRADELRESLDRDARRRLSVFYDVPLDSTMRPEFRQFMIERNKMRAETQQQAAGSMGGRAGNPTEAEPLTGPQQLLK